MPGLSLNDGITLEAYTSKWGEEESRERHKGRMRAQKALIPPITGKCRFIKREKSLDEEYWETDVRATFALILS